ncbi:ABC transporter substrate-binding protein [Dolosicoccus paucivorans]|nr:ABC transporter substrate-binding protein [Dolosicoccus paucivorans]SDI46881.1 multiple sugar transport system substrate-binding protein [Dolosicoccus paucivorans]
MKKFHKLFSVLTLALLVLANVVVPTTHAAEKTQVVFWHAMNGPQQEQLTKMVEEFNQSQDEIEVIEQNQGDYSTLQQSIMASAASGNLPTITQLTASHTPDYAAQGLLTPLDEYLTDENNFGQEKLDDILPGFAAGMKYEDQYYAVPFSKSVRLMFVNQDLLDEIGGEVPTTWEELKALDEKMKAAGKEEPVLGLENGIAAEIETMARQNGAAWISDDLTQVDLGSDQAVEPVNFVKELLDTKVARTAGEDTYMSGPFSQGATLLYIGSSAGIPYVEEGAKESNIHFTTAEIPVYADGEPLTIFAGNDLGVFQSATEEEKNAAVKFMAYLTDHTVDWVTQTGYLPVTQSAIDSQEWQDYVAKNPMFEAASKELPYGIAQPGYQGASEVHQDLVKALDEIFINNASAKEQMQQVEDKVKGFLGL